MMAHFYGEIDGKAQTSATRCGTRKSGISAHVRGWNMGISVRGYVDFDGVEKYTVSITGGSNNPSAIKHIGIFRATDLPALEAQ